MTNAFKKDEILNSLNLNSQQYKFIVGKKIRTKNIPKIKFIYDKMFGLELKVD